MQSRLSKTRKDNRLYFWYTRPHKAVTLVSAHAEPLSLLVSLALCYMFANRKYGNFRKAKILNVATAGKFRHFAKVKNAGGVFIKL